METDHCVLKKAQTICENFNKSNFEYELAVSNDSKEIAEFYKTYNGVKEFLYIAPQEEIEEALQGGAIYFVIKDNNKIAGIAKASKLNLPYPFFCVPKTMDKTKDYWGLSGLYVHQNYRGKKLSSVLLKASTSLAQISKANGIYADFDYRNIKSMQLLSKYYDLLGYTDGRNGSPDEATIYTTFFKDFTNSGENISYLNIIFEQICAGNAKQTLDAVMENIGDVTTHIVNYCDGYNEIVCFDKPYKFNVTNIKVLQDITKFQKFEKNIDKKQS